MVLVHPLQYASFVVAAQVEVLEPHEVAVVLGAFDDSLHVGDVGEDGRDEAGGVDAGLVELPHGLKPARGGVCTRCPPE